MVASTSPLAYTDCFDLLDQALAAPKGVRVAFPSPSAAHAFRFRLNYARAADRGRNLHIFEPDHPMHGQSEYDQLAFRIKPLNGSVYLYIERLTGPLKIEIIDESSELT